MDIFIIAAVLYTIGILALFMPKRMQMHAHWVSCLAAAGGSLLVLARALEQLVVGEDSIILGLGPYSLACDGWSAIFLLFTGIVGLLTSVYAIGYARSYVGVRLRLMGGMWNLFLLSMVFVLLAGDAFTFLLFWEIMAVASFMLVNQESEKHATWSAAYQYLVMTSLGTAAIMIAFLITASGSESFSFAALSANALYGWQKHAVFVTAFIGFALKAGLMPLHVWLPQAHPAAPSHVSALMSGVMLKLALYGFGRFMFDFLPDWDYWWGVVILLVGAGSAFLGVLYAQMENDIKRILAYSSIENMGVIFAAFGCAILLKVSVYGNWYMIGILAALVHAFNHSIMKSLMFMCAGSIMHGTGSKNLELFGGLWRRMPITAICTLGGSMALSALPLTNGFTGEWLLLQSLVTLAVQDGSQGVRIWVAVALILLGFAGALALGCFVRFFGIAFLGRPRSELAENAVEADNFMLGSMCVACGLVFVFGIFPAPLLLAAFAALGLPEAFVMEKLGFGWSGSGSPAVYQPAFLLVVLALMALLVYFMTKDIYVVRDSTWNCGTYPTSRQQYSATGFSKPLRRAFDYLLQPTRLATYIRKDNAYFGRQKAYKLEIHDRISERLYKPVQERFVKASAFLRRLQQGSVRLYVSYVMAAMILVLIWGAVYK